LKLLRTKGWRLVLARTIFSGRSLSGAGCGLRFRFHCQCHGDVERVLSFLPRSEWVRVAIEIVVGKVARACSRTYRPASLDRPGLRCLNTRSKLLVRSLLRGQRRWGTKFRLGVWLALGGLPICRVGDSDEMVVIHPS
jgi:hypothetical protein